MPHTPHTGIGGAVGARGILTNPVVRVPAVGLERAAPALEGIAAELQDLKEREDQVRSVKVEGEARRAKTEAAADLDPTSPSYLRDLTELFNEADSDALDNSELSTQLGRQRLQATLERQSQDGLFAGASLKRQAVEEQALDQRSILVDETLSKVRANPSEEAVSAILLDHSEKMSRLLPSIRPEDRPALAEEFGDAVITATVEGLATQGLGDEARGFIRANEGELSPSQTRALKQLVRSIEGKQRTDNLAARARTKADVQIAISNATTMQELIDVDEKVKALDEGGFFEGQEGARANLVAASNNRKSSLAKQGRDLATALTNYASGTLATREQTDLAYDALKPLPEAGPDAAREFLGVFTSRSGRVPTTVSSFIRNTEQRGGDQAPEALAVSADLILTMQAASRGIDTGEHPRADLVISLMRLAEQAPIDAARQVIDNVPDKATADKRREELNELMKDFDAADELRSEGAVPGGGYFGAEFNVAVSPAAEQAFGEMVALFHVMYGDFEVATDAAVSAFGRQYGVDHLGGGDPRVVRNPSRVDPSASGAFPPGSVEEAAVQTEYYKDILESVGVGFEDDIKAEDDIVGVFRRARGGRGAKRRTLTTLRQGKVQDADDTGFVPLRDREFSAVVPSATDRTRDLGMGDFRVVTDAITDQDGTRKLQVRTGNDTFADVRVLTPQGEVVLRASPPEGDELRALPSYQAHVGREARTFSVRQRLDEATRMAIEQYESGSPMVRPVEVEGGPTQVKSEEVTEPVEEVAEITRDTSTTIFFDSILTGKLSRLEAMAIKSTPRGIRNHNPGNIRKSNVKWGGMASEQGDKSFVRFSTPVMGLRALARVLLTYNRKHGIDTIEGVVSRWAPPSENDTQAYIAAVEKLAGTSRSAAVRFDSDEAVMRLVKAIITVENGVQPYPDQMILEGVQRAR